MRDQITFLLILFITGVFKVKSNSFTEELSTILNAALKTALDANYNNNAELAAIPPAVGNIGATGPTKSIHVPFIKNGNDVYTADSCITITTLLNQWNVYTKDHTPASAGSRR